MTAVAVPYPSPKLNPNPHQGDISEESRDLVGRMLTVDPERRATILQIRQHAWLRVCAAAAATAAADSERAAASLTGAASSGASEEGQVKDPLLTGMAQL